MRVFIFGFGVWGFVEWIGVGRGGSSVCSGVEYLCNCMGLIFVVCCGFCSVGFLCLI